MNDGVIREVETRFVFGYGPTIQDDVNGCIRGMIDADWELYSSPVVAMVHDGDGDMFHSVLLTFKRDTMTEPDKL